MNKIIFFLLACLVFSLPGTPLAGEKDAAPFRLLLQWTPQAQFAGFFVAREKGMYKDLGLDLEIISGGPDLIVSDMLDSGRADFGLMFLTTAMERHGAGMPLVNIGQLLHHSSLMLITRADSEIQTIADLDGQKVAVWANEFQIQFRMLFSQAGIDVDMIPLAGSMDLFLRRAVSATSAMWYNGYHTILSAGVRERELHSFYFKDTSFDFPEDGLYCLDDTLKKYPDAARALLQGTLAGWQYAFDHEDEALDIVAEIMTRAGLPVNKAHQRWMFRRMRDIMLHNGIIAQNGFLDEQTVNTMNGRLLQAGAMRNAVEYSTFYKGPTR